MVLIPVLPLSGTLELIPYPTWLFLVPTPPAKVAQSESKQNQENRAGEELLDAHCDVKLRGCVSKTHPTEKMHIRKAELPEFRGEDSHQVLSRGNCQPWQATALTSLDNCPNLLSSSFYGFWPGLLFFLFFFFGLFKYFHGYFYFLFFFFHVNLAPLEWQPQWPFSHTPLVSPRDAEKYVQYKKVATFKTTSKYSSPSTSLFLTIQAREA